MSSTSISSNVTLMSLIIIIVAVILNITVKNKIIKYLLLIFLLYILNLVLIGFTTAQETCLPGKAKTSIVISQSIWAPLFGAIILGAINIPFLKGFFQEPFINLFGSKYGVGVSEGVNLMGICLAAELMTYFNIQKNGCTP